MALVAPPQLTSTTRRNIDDRTWHVSRKLSSLVLMNTHALEVWCAQKLKTMNCSCLWWSTRTKSVTWFIMFFSWSFSRQINVQALRPACYSPKSRYCTHFAFDLYLSYEVLLYFVFKFILLTIRLVIMFILL